jgi:hypothetical protein
MVNYDMSGTSHPSPRARISIVRSVSMNVGATALTVMLWVPIPQPDIW